MSEDRRFGTATGERKPLREEPSWEQVLAKNSIERLKKDRQPVGIVHEIPALAAKHYLDVDEEDIVRLQWYGLYHDKPKTGQFMLRIKVPAGLLPPQSLRAIGVVADHYGEGQTELSTRQNVQLHFIRLGQVPDILAALREAGLTTAGACGDAVRNITGCPLGGVRAGGVRRAGGRWPVHGSAAGPGPRGVDPAGGCPAGAAGPARRMEGGPQVP